ncbi:minor capsid protein [Leisingera caerulea]|uniref:CdiA C-terminal domain-containing protein n=1 Tax=Leisingera caerulea TaxID=506591 RepID=UPI0021A6376F|nr:phage minor head protein [Leisingera caerulea]UWQ63825.1 minor capsid protein [Leisingera caerulea]
MQHSFSHFLRHGGDGQYEITQRHGHLIGRCVGVSLKSTFPNYTALRADFSERLEQVISENTRMLLNALTPPDTVPTVSEAELRDVSDAKAEALNAWDARLAHIFGEYQNHPQRLRPLRTAMEERLLRAFAGLINQLRQETLGIEQYIWRSQDDAKVRDSHAAYDDRMFRWDEPPEGGHPGEAHNCRCYAEPIFPAVSNNVVFADFAPTADSFPNGNNTVRRLGNGLLARSPAGLAAYAALEASNQLQDFTRAANERRVRDAAEILVADLGTVEGVLAAQAYALAKELAENGFLSDAPERGDRARLIAEAIGLYEMVRPGLFTIPNNDAAGAVERARQLAADTLAALEAQRLTPVDGELAQGWVEVFPELTEVERRLGQLPGFTPERIEQWLETYPIEDLGLPHHTGSPIPDDPTGNIISTPIPEETGPNIVAVRPGEPTPIDPNSDEATQRGHRRENESAQILGQNGFDVFQNPAVDGPKNPDYLINGEIYDHYAPSTDRARNIWSEVKDKIDEGQTANIVIGLYDSNVDEDALRQQFLNWPIEGLGDVIIVRRDGTIGRL